MDCIICLGEITSVFTILTCNCKQTIYHPKCINSWLNIALHCPQCKHLYKHNPKLKKITLNKTNQQLNRALFLDSIGRSGFINNPDFNNIPIGYNINYNIFRVMRGMEEYSR